VVCPPIDVAINSVERRAGTFPRKITYEVIPVLFLLKEIGGVVSDIGSRLGNSRPGRVDFFKSRTTELILARGRKTRIPTAALYSTNDLPHL